MRARAQTIDCVRPQAPPSPVQRPLPAPGVPPSLELPPRARGAYKTLDPPLSSSAPQLTMMPPRDLMVEQDVDMTIEGFGDDDDVLVFSLEEDKVPSDDEDGVDGTWIWSSTWGTAKLRHDSLESRSTCGSTPPPSFVGSPVLHACLEELREKRLRSAA